ncbi:MAG: cytochrome c [Candidatus Competibacteraceae bacterium]
MQHMLAMHPRRRLFEFSPLDPKPSREGVFFYGPHPQPLSQRERGVIERLSLWEEGVFARLPIVLLLLGGIGFGSPTLAQEPPAPSPERSRELVRMVRQDCGSCHGLTLRGGLGPALLPEALRDKPPAGLKYTILLGRPGTAMPPWQPFLSEAEADWVVTQLLRGFPEESK